MIRIIIRYLNAIIFSEKGNFLGLIDIHCHILAGLDDGTADDQEILQICRSAYKAGYTTMVATPHVLSGAYNNNQERINEAVLKAQQSCDQEEIYIRILPGAEYYLDDMFLNLLGEGKCFGLNYGKYLLVELPMVRLPKMAPEFAFRIRLKGFIPILAHPERYADISEDPKKAHDLVDMGYLLQVNLGSFEGLYGRHCTRAVQYLFNNQLIFAISTDIHTTKYMEIIYEDALDLCSQSMNQEDFEILFKKNPAKVIGLDGFEMGESA